MKSEKGCRVTLGYISGNMKRNLAHGNPWPLADDGRPPPTRILPRENSLQPDSSALPQPLAERGRDPAQLPGKKPVLPEKSLLLPRAGSTPSATSGC